MSLKSVPFALRAKTRSPLHKLLLVYVVHDSGQPDEDEGYVPCLTSLNALAEMANVEELVVHQALVDLKNDGLLRYLSVYDGGHLVIEPVLPAVVPFEGGVNRG